VLGGTSVTFYFTRGAARDLRSGRARYSRR
jgi:hypothetical protein